MKNSVKKILFCLFATVLLFAVAMGAFTASAATDDPADSYVKQTAPNEDPSISMWFEHSFKKVLTEDKTPSGMDTYSVYMAKNEIENAQFVLYSDTTKANMSAFVSNFTDKDGNEIPAEIYYQMYVTVEDVQHDYIYGLTDPSEDYIREGETPDPVYPLAKIGSRFQLNGGKSQAFYIRLKTAENTPSGWYSAQLDVKNSSGQIVKTATVYCYVWDFTISEKTELQTSFILSNNTSYGGSYQKFYDYMLENRLCATDVPGKLTESNPYLTNPRVSAIRVSGYIEAGENPGSKYDDQALYFPYYTDIYNRLSQSEIWDEVKDKLYFYNTDEPLPGELAAGIRDTITEAYSAKSGIDKYWGEENPRIVIPHGENHPYPYYTFTNEVKPLSSYSPSVLTDAETAMFDDNLCTIWCPRIYGFTPMSEIAKTDYTCVETSIIRTNSGPYSGNISKWGLDYYIWEDIFGEFSDRVKSEMVTDSADVELWAYSAGYNKNYTYTNHLIENTGLQTKMMFWQLYQEDCTGYLYYASNNWSEQDGNVTTPFADKTPTGSNIMCEWKTNKWLLGSTGKYMYGNGVLFYGAQQAKMRGVTDYVGSIRVEMMRDGIEEYQMLTMIEDYLGEAAAKEIVGRVSNNVVDYLSLPKFSTSQWASSMDEYDIMASVRVDMGNILEAAVAEGQCDHSWDGGEVTKEPTCLTIGYTTYTCTDCGAQRDEYIAAYHNEGSCFEVTSPSTATCTEDGKVTMKCKHCGFVRERTVSAFHNDSDYYTYKETSAKGHAVVCTVCNESIASSEHYIFVVNTAPTCTEDGISGNACKLCGYGDKTVTPSKGHTYEGGSCIDCGEADPDWSDTPDYTPGDLNGDGAVNSMDANLMKRILAGILTPTEEQILAGDFDGNSVINGMDSNVLVRVIAGTN